MRELTVYETNCVSGGASATEYIILFSQSEASTNQALKTQTDTAKNSIGNIR